METEDVNIISSGARLKKCPKCKTYTLKDICKTCSQKTQSAHYIFPKIKNAPPRSAPFKRK
ncbi:hypothetical protein J4226_04670 [Candidatus Pacearchaeota archaeon]|nr:hypothetical protein [Candidatus Pacearchaeota archaeon]